MKLSVVIPCRNEFPNVVHTVHNILTIWETDGFDQKEIEIILVDNASSDNWFYPQRASKGTSTHLLPRGIYWSRVLRHIYDPICGNHAARNKGARVALGEYVFFSDAHMSYAPGFFKYMLTACEESGGLVHATIAWMGGYPPYGNDAVPHGLGFQYTIKLGEEIKGTWSPRAVSTNDWFYIPAQGHCSVMAKRKQFLDFGGYPDIHRTYGGGEFYTDMKYWLFGSSVVVEPRAVGYHLYSYRNYSYDHDDYLHNVMNCGLALGMDDWVERFYINCLRRGRKPVLDRMLSEAKREVAGDRAFVEKHQKQTFNELIVSRPWDTKNDAKFGTHASGLQIFHDTILPLFRDTPAQEAYEHAEHQENLAKFIDEKLSPFVYRRNVV